MVPQPPAGLHPRKDSRERTSKAAAATVASANAAADATNDAAKASAPAAINGAAAPSHGCREAGDPSVHPNATNGTQASCSSPYGAHGARRAQHDSGLHS